MTLVEGKVMKIVKIHFVVMLISVQPWVQSLIRLKTTVLIRLYYVENITKEVDHTFIIFSVTATESFSPLSCTTPFPIISIYVAAFKSTLNKTENCSSRLKQLALSLSQALVQLHVHFKKLVFHHYGR